ncbi:MAG: hypothetical protein HYU66_12120 [Armatimonadetes bacterium]|nr:hypothetical protein [Armatimonadota bacterium]
MAMRVHWVWALAAALAVGGAPAAEEQVLDGGAIVIGKAQELKLDANTAIRYALKVDAAGLLTVATRGEGGDVVLEVADIDNQALRGGQSDQDLNEKACDEQAVVEIPYEETWHVKVSNVGDDAAKVTLVVGFVAFPAVARQPDPDGRPSLAAAIGAGAAKDEALDSANGDLLDWYKFTAHEEGRLTIFTKGDKDLDLGLRVVAGEHFDQALGESDQDLDEETASEGLVVPVKANTVYYIAVEALVDSAGKYKVGVQFTKF